MGAGAGRPIAGGETLDIHSEMLTRTASGTERVNSKYLAERSLKRWSSKGDGVLWGKLSSLDKEDIGDIYLQGDVFSIGRDGVLCTYQIVNKLVSSYHLELKVEQYGKSVRVIFVHDHSTNGTFIDGTRVGAGNKVLLSEGAKLSLPWFSNGVEKVVSFRYEPIKVVSDDWEPILHKYTFGTITFEGTFTTYQLLTPKTSGPPTQTDAKPAPREILTAKIINMQQMQHAFSSKSAKDMVRKEITLLGRLHHRNIAALRDSFEGQEYSFLVFKYPKLSPHRAYDLSELLQLQWDTAGIIMRERLVGQTPDVTLVSEALVRVLLRQLVEVVAYIHSQDVSHRNISPENCLLEYDDARIRGAVADGSNQNVGVTLKLSNFGFASTFSDNVAMQTKIETGHIDFCAPEMILQEHGYGKEVDLWSVGVLTMMLLGGGQAPFRKESLLPDMPGTTTNSTGSMDTEHLPGGKDEGGGAEGRTNDSSNANHPQQQQQQQQQQQEAAQNKDGNGIPANRPRAKRMLSKHTSHPGEESGLSTASVIENITQARYDFVPKEIWSVGRSEACKEFIRCLLVADPARRASAEALLGGQGANWLNE